MKTYALFAIDKYHNERLLCLIPAATIAEAARKLACEAVGVGKSSEQDYTLYFEARQECARLAVRDPDAFHRALAKGCNPDAPSDVLEKMVVGYAYGTDNVYREYLIGTAPVFR